MRSNEVRYEINNRKIIYLNKMHLDANMVEKGLMFDKELVKECIRKKRGKYIGIDPIWKMFKQTYKHVKILKKGLDEAVDKWVSFSPTIKTKEDAYLALDEANAILEDIGIVVENSDGEKRVVTNPEYIHLPGTFDIDKHSIQKIKRNLSLIENFEQIDILRSYSMIKRIVVIDSYIIGDGLCNECTMTEKDLHEIEDTMQKSEWYDRHPEANYPDWLGGVESEEDFWEHTD